MSLTVHLARSAGLLALLTCALACGDGGADGAPATVPPGGGGGIGGSDAAAGADTTMDAAAPGDIALPDVATPDGYTKPDSSADAAPPPDGVTPVDDATVPPADVPDTAEDVVIPPAKCEAHTDCPGLQLCDQVCIDAPICLDELDCTGNHVCTRGRCNPTPIGCGKDSDCSGGYCNASVGKCADLYPCESDAGCADGGRCIGGQCVECTSIEDCPVQAVACAFNACQGPVDCTKDSDCLYGLACIGDTCSVPFAAPDPFEPNETAETASALIPGEFMQLTIDQDDADWYRIEVPADHALLVRLDFDDAYGQLDLELQRWPDGLVVSKDQRDAPFAVVGVGLQPVKTAFLLHVSHVAGVVPTYGLQVWLSPKGFCINDSLDEPVPNNNKTLASVLSGSSFESGGLAICEADEDWFKLKKSTSFDLVVTAAYPVAGGELSIALVPEDDAAEEKEVTGAGGQAILDLKNVKSGTWYVRIRGTLPEFTTTYSVKIDAQDTGFCDPDSFEPNDVPAKAQLLGEGLEDELTLCTDDIDHYRVELPPGKQARVTIAWSFSSGVLGLAALTDELEPTIIEEVSVPEINNGVAAHEIIAHDPDLLESILFRVTRLGSPDPFPITPYILTMELQDIPCEEEESEDNDTPADAVELGPDEGTLTAALCQPDPADWYKIHLKPGEPLDIGLAYGGKKGKLVLHLYDPKGVTLLATGQAVGKVGTAIRMTVPAWWKEADYLLLITGTGDNPYTLKVDTSGVVTACEGDDALEPNDSPLEAAKGTLEDTTELVVCDQDPDVLSFELQAGVSYQATVKGLSDEPSFKIKVFDPGGTLIAQETVTESYKVIFLPASKIKETGTWYVQVEAATPQTVSVKVGKVQ